MFPSSVKPWLDSGDAAVYPTEFVVKNGKVIVNKPLISFNAWSNNNVDVSGKKMSYTFENIIFEVSQNVSEALVTYSQHNTTTDAEANPELHFTDCTFDLTNAMSGVVLFNLGNAYTDSTITVRGCEIILGANSVVLVSENDVSGGATTLDGSVTFEKNAKGSYMTVTAPVGVALPEL